MNRDPFLRRVSPIVSVALAAVVLAGCNTNSTETAAPGPEGTQITQVYGEDVPIPANMDEATRAAVRVRAETPTYEQTGAGTAIDFGGDSWTDIITAAHVVALDNSNCSQTTIYYQPGHWRLSPTTRGPYSATAALQSPVAALRSTRFNSDYNGGFDAAMVETNDPTDTNTLNAQQQVSLNAGDFLYAIAYGPEDKKPVVVPGEVVETDPQHGQFTFIVGFNKQEGSVPLEPGDSGGPIVSDTDNHIEYDGDIIAGYDTTKGAMLQYTGQEVENTLNVRLPRSYLKRLFYIITGQKVTQDDLARMRLSSMQCQN